MSPNPDLTHLLQAWRSGDSTALEQLTPFFCNELRRVVERYLDRERHDHTLSPDVLIHEAYLRVLDQTQPDWQVRSHFSQVVASLMRQILVDFARCRRVEARVTLDSLISSPTVPEVNPVFAADVVDFEDALNQLEHLDGRKAKTIELHYFAGLTPEEVAAVLGISLTTTIRDLRFAEAWLCRELTGNRDHGRANSACA